jgi:hypothetical protein
MGFKSANQNGSLSLQIKMSFIIVSLARTNTTKIQKPQFTQNPKFKQNIQTNHCK